MKSLRISFESRKALGGVFMFRRKKEEVAPAGRHGASVLTVDNLSVRFSQYAKGLRRRELEVISALNIVLRAGEVSAVVGSSGSGKSLLAHAILDILPSNARVSGTIRYNGRILTEKWLEKLRGTEIAIIPQSVTYLDPLMKIGSQIRGVRGTDERVREVMKRYGLDPSVADMYPRELSGGMLRRVLVATAVISGARLIIADEPTPGLSEDLAREALGHLRELADAGCAVMLITHDLRLALDVSDRVAIFYAGTTVETARREDFDGGRGLRHPYTRALWAAMPQNDFAPLPGTQPYAGTAAGCCPFLPRCAIATDDCRRNIEPREVRGGTVRCIHAD